MLSVSYSHMSGEGSTMWRTSWMLTSASALIAASSDW